MTTLNTYWLIERGSPCEWWVSNHRISNQLGGEWTTDSSKALKFSEWGAKTTAAQLESCGIRGPLRVTEHIDMHNEDVVRDEPVMSSVSPTNKKIFKYPLQVGLNELAMPSNCIPLSAQMQNGFLVMWAECGVDEPLISFEVLVIGTGQPFDREMHGKDFSYLSTVQNDGFVWHVYT
jgi:hypothetical protein